MILAVVGESCALGAALCWALALVMFKRSGEHVSALALNLFKNVVGLVLLVATMIVVPTGREAYSGNTTSDVLLLAFSGVLGIAVADTLFLQALHYLGVGLISVVECLYSPFILFFSFVLLSEPLGPAQFLGAGLIVAAVLIVSRNEPPAGRTKLELTIGVLLGAGAMTLMTFGIVFVKPVLDVANFPLIPATTIRLAAGTLLLALFACVSPKRREHFKAFRPNALWRLSVPGSVLGTYLAMIFWVAGFKYANASTAGILNQTSIVFAIILATLILKEPFTRRKFVAVSLAVLGVLIVTFHDKVELWTRDTFWAT